ncbi:MAG: FAD-dependent oxidoreductase, partial [Firmicutes bacterium]|nr:FAD-dependent oxidoreductase [Bacillota bacterium]
RKLKGFDRDDSVMTAVETRSSSPVRITRDEQLQSVSCKGLIPAGEGPGYAGGIMSAAVDGIRAAEQIILLK